MSDAQLLFLEIRAFRKLSSVECLRKWIGHSIIHRKLQPLTEKINAWLRYSPKDLSLALQEVKNRAKKGEALWMSTFHENMVLRSQFGHLALD